MTMTADESILAAKHDINAITDEMCCEWEEAAIYGLSDLLLKTTVSMYQDEKVTGYELALEAVSRLLRTLIDSDRIDYDYVVTVFAALLSTTDREDPYNTLHF